MTAGEAEVGLTDAGEALAVWWWLEERRLVDAGQLVQRAEVCQTAGSS